YARHGRGVKRTHGRAASARPSSPLVQYHHEPPVVSRLRSAGSREDEDPAPSARRRGKGAPSEMTPPAKFRIGPPIKRFEAPRLVRGQGRFHDDVHLPGEAHAVIVRSTHAHARIRGIDTKRAREAAGVLAVYTGADVAALGTMQMTLKRKRPDGSPMF